MGPTERTHWQLDVSLPADQVLAALVDFSPRREVIWKETGDPAVYRVHAVGRHLGRGDRRGLVRLEP